MRERLTAAMTSTVAAADRARGAKLPPAQVLVRAPGFEFAAGDRARRFHAASVGKAMTATRAYQLAEAGRLDLDAPLTGLVPEA
ncbi:MAG: serine hydrolase, partial [Microbacterium sp.]